ncbi:MAG: 23S rRNA (uracil(1939)-C(5))-methyltransferase RlmD [Oscillospiraceae bacterium]|jgi:23S rRNA (uracil1939-C5)-methyltransferase|nr:23S rRNA (uracil(1939)-C(5))-methyltransferase RlmD [Oscillospiraceae bacterium]
MLNLSPNQTAEIIVTGADGNGGGIAYADDGRVIFVSGALPGERVRVLPFRVSKTVARTNAIEILSPSPERVTPACRHFPGCGGCDYLHASYAEELRQKLERVNDAFSHIGGLSLCAEKILSCDSGREGSRNKAVFNIDPNGSIGFYRERSHEVVYIKRCLLQSDFANEILRPIRKWIRDTRISIYNEDSGKGLLRKVFTRGTQIAIVAKGKPNCAEELCNRLTAAVGENYNLMWNDNHSKGNTVFGDKFYRIYGAEPQHTMLGVDLRVSPSAFLQVNTPQAEKLYKIAIDFAEVLPGESVLDLYCGVGVITLLIARKCARVTGVEISAAAIQSAKENAALNGITNAEFIVGDAAKTPLPDADVIFTDPPRKGLDSAVIAAIADSPANRVVYISCDPATLARDLRLFAEYGFSAVQAVCVDMFPGTRHVESVVSLRRLGVTRPSRT